MEKLIKILLIALVLTGCKVTKKATELTVAKTSVQTELTQQVKTQDVVKVQNDVNSELETTTVTTEYYKPHFDTVLPSTASRSGSGAMANTGAVKSVTVTKTTKKDTDKSKVEATNAKQEDTKTVQSSKSEVRSDKKEVKKTGVAQWKVIVGVLALLLVIYFLVQKGIIKVPLLTKAANWIRGILGTPKGKAA